MTKPTVVGTKAARVMSSSEQNFWDPAPVLSGFGGPCAGHVRAEVWSDGFVCLAMTSPGLAGAALAALKGSNHLTAADRTLPSQPVMMERSEAPFLGHVVVEFWNGRAPVVGAIGFDSASLIRHTENLLTKLS